MAGIDAMRRSAQSPGTVTLIGSGEFSASMGRVHRAVLSKVSGPARAVFLDTPAGFELNADQISAKAVRYFKQRLQEDLDVASFKSVEKATPAEIKCVLNKLRSTHVVFAGPGSPTYAVRHWRDTVVFEAVSRRLAKGAHLVLASAAAIAIGRYALPVYEIYKVGEAPHWVEGLDLLGPYGLDLAIIPHWNNAEGGTHDTRYCFMGEPRLQLLEQCLPDSTTILGIDEYTACVLDLSSGHGHVMGAGRVTARFGGDERVFPAGTVFELERLKCDRSTENRGGAHKSLWSTREQGVPASELPLDWDDQPDARDGGLERVTPFIELLIAVRAELRAGKRWALADEIRQQLSALGIVLEDGPNETIWRRD